MRQECSRQQAAVGVGGRQQAAGSMAGGSVPDEEPHDGDAEDRGEEPGHSAAAAVHVEVEDGDGEHCEAAEGVVAGEEEDVHLAKVDRVGVDVPERARKGE